MTIREKIEAVKKVQEYRKEISDLLETIISDTSDYHCRYVDNFTINDKTINVDYWWTCRGESERDEVNVPIEWLDEGFDYKTAYQKKLEREQAAERRRAAAEERREKKRKEKQEYENYLKLKKKYEG